MCPCMCIYIFHVLFTLQKAARLQMHSTCIVLYLLFNKSIFPNIELKDQPDSESKHLYESVEQTWTVIERQDYKIQFPVQQCDSQFKR